MRSNWKLGPNYCASMSNKRSAAPTQENDHKKRKQEDLSEVRMYIIERRIPLARLKHLKEIARKKGFTIAKTLDSTVTHVVTSLPTREKVNEGLDRPISATHLVNLAWLTDCFTEDCLLPVTDNYIIKDHDTPAIEMFVNYWYLHSSRRKTHKPILEHSDYTYACERPTPLHHHNENLTKALEVLERYYLHLDYKSGDTRATAFRQASCSLKAYPKKIVRIDEAASLPRVGKHSLQIIQDILENETSEEVERCSKSEWFHCMELFCSVYGCASATAQKWYDRGLRTLDDVQECQDLELSEVQKIGFKYYKDLSMPVTRLQAECIKEFIEKQLSGTYPGATLEVVGGYRRGKDSGHDIDLLISHPDNSVINGLLEDFVTKLKQKGLMIHCDITTGNNTVGNTEMDHTNQAIMKYTPDGKQKKVKFDHFDKAFCVMKLTGEHCNSLTQSPQVLFRVDLIVVPAKQYYCALLSWTGSKQFNRSLRQYSYRKCSKTITAHSIYDTQKHEYIYPSSEEEIFSILELPYLSPSLRNC